MSVGNPIDLDEPLRVTVTGYAFCDSAHFSRRNPKKDMAMGPSTLGQLWEVHPVWKVEFADQ